MMTCIGGWAVFFDESVWNNITETSIFIDAYHVDVANVKNYNLLISLSRGWLWKLFIGGL